MKLNNKRVALYCRVSTEEQARSGESIEDQLQALHRWAKDQGCIPVGNPYIDAGYSAHKRYTTRPALMRLLDDVKAGDVDIIAFTKLDRWGRRSGDYYAVQDILDAHGVGWVAILEDYDTTTSDGRFKVGIMMSVNQHEAERTSDRIKFTFSQKRTRGELYCGNLPRGYKIENKKPVIDPETSAAVRAFWGTYCRGAGLNAAREAAAAHGMIIGMSSASYMLRTAENYAGCIQGVPCDPYLSPDQLQYVLSTRKAAPRSTGYAFLFSGLVTCAECGGRMGSHRHRIKSGWYVYYNCTRSYAGRECGSRANISEKAIESYLLEHVQSALDGLRFEAEAKPKELQGDDNKIRLGRLQSRRKRLLEAYLDGVISKDELRDEREKIDAEIAELEIEKEPAADPDRISEALPESWEAIYADLDREHKALFWRSIIKEIKVTKEKSISFSFI